MADEPAGSAARRVVDVLAHASEDVRGDVPIEGNSLVDVHSTHRQEYYCSLAGRSTGARTLLSDDAVSELSAEELFVCSENTQKCAQQTASTADDQCGDQDASMRASSRDGPRVTDERRSGDCILPNEEMPKEKGDEEKRSTKEIGGAIKLEEDADRRSLGGWGEKIGLNVITAFPMYEARSRADALDEDEVVRRFAIFAEERGSREGLCRRGEPGQELPREKNKPPRSRSRYKPSQRDEEDNKQRTLSKRRGGNLCEGRQRDSPDITFVNDVMDDLIEEFEAQPILKKPLPRRSASKRRGDRSPPRRRTSPARTRSSPVRGPRRSSPRGPGAASRLRSYASTVVRSRSSSDQPDDKELERVWTVCSLLESITGDVTTEARRVYEPRGDTSQTINRAVSGEVDTDQVSEDAPQDYIPTKSKHAPRKNKEKNKESTKGRKTRRKSMEKNTNNKKYTARAKQRGASRHEEEPESDEELERADKKNKCRGRSRQRLRRGDELESDEWPERAEERNGGKSRARSRQRLRREEELESDEVEPRPNRSKRREQAEAERKEVITEAETSATEISVEDMIETNETVDAKAEKRAKASKKRKVRFFTNLVFRRRPPSAVESTLSEQRAFSKRGPEEILWRPHDEVVVRTSSDGIIDAEIEASQEEQWSTKQSIVRRSSSGQIFLTIDPRRKPMRTQDDSEDGRFSKVSKVEGLAIEVDASVSEDDESLREPKKKYYCQLQKPGNKDDGRDVATENALFLLERSSPNNLVVRSEASSSIYGDGIEVKTGLQTGSSFEEMCEPQAEDDDQPLFRARIGRRSAMPPDEPAEDEEDVRLLTARIGRRSNASVTGSVTRAASVICTDSDGRNVHHILSDGTAITSAAPRRPSRSVSIDLELPHAWSVEPCQGESTVPESVSRVLHRPRRHRHSHWSRSRSRHRRHRYGRPLCDLRRSSQMSHAVQLIPAAAVPPYRYMCAQQPVTQVYTSFSPPPVPPPVRPPLYPPSIVPPACMEPNLHFENRRYHRPPPPWAFRRQPPPYKQEMVISQQNMSQAPPAPLATASRATTTVSFATALDAEVSQQQQQQPTTIIFQGATNEGPSAQFHVTAAAAAPETTVVVEPPDQTLVCVTATPATSARRSDSTACRRLSTSTEIRPSTTAQSVDAVHFVESSQRNDSSSSSDTHVTTVWQARFLDNWEQEKQPPEAKSTDPIIPRENRLYGTLVKNLPQRGHSMLYIILLVGTLAGMAATFSIYARRHARHVSTENDADTEGSGQQPWMFGPWVNGDAAKRVSCFDPSCINQFVQLSRSLDSTVSPCQNFYGHVCSARRTNGTVDEQIAQQTESHVVGFFKGIGSPDRDLPVASASRRLWKDCVDLATLSKLGRAPLQALLNLTGLGGWPYAGVVQPGQVWRTAGMLQRLMGLAPLVGVVALPDGTVQLVPGDQGSLEADDVLDSMLALRRNSSRLRDLAADVADLGRRLSGLRERRAPTDGSDVQPPQLYLDAALEGLHRPGAVRVGEAGLLKQYVLLVNKSSSRTVLNLLGYRLIRHVDLFTPAVVKTDLNSGASSRRESLCARMTLEYALTADAAEYVRYASLRRHLDFDLVRSTAAQLKRVLVAKLSELRWVDGTTRKSAQTRLRELKVRFFFDRYEGSNGSAQARWPTAIPSQALATYQRFREARFRSQLSQGDDVLGAQQQCAYDVGYKVMFVGLSAVEVREPESPAWPAFQAARLGPRLARCLLHVLLQRVHWSAASRGRLEALRSRGCGHTMADSGALAPAKDVFDTYVRRLGQGATNTPSWDKAFYLVYANSLCEDPDHQRRPQQHDGPHWERVNRPLSADLTFQKVFQCHLQENNSSCSFWGA
ncbi:hypothetical protein HPB49_021705 [Dermacentor silvarum]|uniref:Uncharacterized protein n=1 Tax=Dermacentor silvarum TaxID=543639 RepID=A0ACB8DG86_DERSI|nr:hypothetical protein HPB49_021705 [Dermacentor silvarum]